MGWVTLSQRKMSLKQDHQFYHLRLLEISREKRQMARKKTYETNSIMMQQKQALRDLKANVYETAKNEKNLALKALDTAWKQYQVETKINKIVGTKIEGRNTVYGAGFGDIYKSYMDWENKEENKGKSINEYLETTKWDKNTKEIATLFEGACLNAYAQDDTMKSRTEWEAAGIGLPDGKTKDEILSEFEDASLQYQEQQNEIKSEFEFELQVVEEEAADEELHLDTEQTEIETQVESISQEMQSVGEAVSGQIQATTIRLA